MVPDNELHGGGVMFSEEWETRFSQGESQSTWPWTDLIRYVNKFSKARWGSKVLELGPGVGANIPFFLSRGMDYYAIEGSHSAVNTILARYPELKDKVVVGDFTKNLFFNEKFKIVIDRSSLTHNCSSSIVNSLSLINQILDKNNGKFIGIDWFSWEHSERSLGIPDDDVYTYRFKSGKFCDCGKVHFSTGNHIHKIIKDAGMTLEVLEHKTVQNRMSQSTIGEATWNFVAKGS
jgi:hypothetical protein